MECKVQADVARVDSLAGKGVVHAGVAQAKSESHVPRGADTTLCDHPLALTTPGSTTGLP